ncbi:MAG: hypothetical protein M1835_005375 [Candelina submexicana]|nr:MAG: hypothetical protein M1835_005375 [Candelina submexicana]
MSSKLDCVQTCIHLIQHTLLSHHLQQQRADQRIPYWLGTRHCLFQVYHLRPIWFGASIRTILSDPFRVPRVIQAAKFMEEMVGSGILYKWEDSPALDHKCGTCKTVLSSPRAKKTCFGIHEEVCAKYHNTMFFIGEAHKCEACRKSAELHDKRVREIGTLLEDLKQLDLANRPETLRLGNERKESVEPAEDVFSVVSDISIAPSTLGDDENTGSTANPNRKRLRRKENKAIKKARNWTTSRPQITVLTTEYVQFIHDALKTPKPEPLGTRSHSRNNSNSLRRDGVIAENLAYNSKTVSYHKWVAGHKKEAKSSSQSKAASKDQEVPSEILARLGAEVSVRGASKERKSAVSKLCEAICNHLTMVENEERMTMMRKGGYWRYVDRKQYDLMRANNEIWDWTTGLKMTPAGEKEEPAEKDEDNDWNQVNDLKEIPPLTEDHLADQVPVGSTEESLDSDASNISDGMAIPETSSATPDENLSPELVPGATMQDINDDSTDDGSSSAVDTSYFVANLKPEFLYE